MAGNPGAATVSRPELLSPATTLWDLLDQRVALSPDRPMVADEYGNRLTFAEFRASAERVAAGLAELGVRENDTVAWQLPTTIDTWVLMAAISRLGAVQAPIVPFLRRREVTHIVRQSEATLLIVPRTWRRFDHAALAAEVAADTGCRTLVCEGTAGPLGLPEASPAGLPPAPRPPADGRYPVRWVYYTSGTVADPKGVRHTDPSGLRSSTGFCEIGGMNGDDVLCVPIPISHIAGLMTLTIMLRTGCRSLVVDAFDPVATPAVAAAHDATVLFIAGPMYQAFLDAQRAHGDSPLLPRLRTCCNGGSSLPAALIKEVRQVLGGLGVLTGYGLTECPASTMTPPDSSLRQLAETVGVPAPGVELRVAGPDGECPTGVEGELRLRGPQLFSGYLDPTLNADALDEQGFLRTGDLGVVDADGFVRVTGRLKDIIIRNGENISAREVEDALITHPKVADVAVIGLPDPHTGERCCAAVQLTPEAGSLTLAEVTEHCLALGMARQKVPERLEIVPEIPRATLGKVQKKELRDRFAPSA